jgi:hypothetical protein
MGLWWWQSRADPSAEQSASCADRRNNERKPSSRVLACQVITLSGHRPIQVAIRDVSAGGLGLRTKQPVPKGTFLLVQLQSARREARNFRAQVVHCTPEGNGYWTLGCVLGQELTAEELEAFF